MSPAPAPLRLSRRRALAVAGVAGLAVTTSACSGTAVDEGPDPLLPLAERARSDAALVAAAIAGTPSLGTRLEPLRAARADHATALTQEIDRLAGAATATATPAPAAAPAGATDLAAVRQAVDAAAKEATGIVGTVSVERAGLVGSVAACCTAYSAILAVQA